MTAAFVIRFHYPSSDPRLKWRLSYFQAMVLPRILANGCGFDIAVRCYPEHDEIFRSMSGRIVPFHIRNEEERKVQKYGRIYFEDFAPWSDVLGLGKYDLQMGLDSDDLIGPGYVAGIKAAIAENGEGKPLHVCYQPEIFDADRLRVVPIGVQYTPKRGSAFFGIYQPAGNGYIFSYEDSHLKLWRHFPRSIVLPAGSAWATAHGLNESTKAKNQP